jgi:hypothetical protein
MEAKALRIYNKIGRFFAASRGNFTLFGCGIVNEPMLLPRYGEISLNKRMRDLEL